MNIGYNLLLPWGEHLCPRVVTDELRNATPAFFALLDMITPANAPTRYIAEPTILDTEFLVRHTKLTGA